MKKDSLVKVEASGNLTLNRKGSPTSSPGDTGSSELLSDAHVKIDASGDLTFNPKNSPTSSPGDIRIDELPSDVILHIKRFLTPGERGFFTATNRTLKTIDTEEWLYIYKRQFPFLYKNTKAYQDSLAPSSDPFGSEQVLKTLCYTKGFPEKIQTYLRTGDLSGLDYEDFLHTYNDRKMDVREFALATSQPKILEDLYSLFLRKHQTGLLPSTLNINNDRILSDEFGVYCHQPRERLPEFLRDNPKLLLGKAVKFNHYALAEQLLNEVVGLDESDSDLVYKAMRQSDIRIAELLIERGANLNHLQLNELYPSPLHLAVKQGNIVLIRFMITKGCKIDYNHETIRMDQPLHIAVQEGRMDIARSLVEAGADVNSRGKDYQSPLEDAIKIDSLELVKYLVSKGARLREDKGDISLLCLACTNGSAKLVAYLLDTNVSNLSSKMAFYPLHNAACAGKIEILALFKQRGYNLGMVDSRLGSLIEKTIEHNQAETAKFLIDNSSFSLSIGKGILFSLTMTYNAEIALHLADKVALKPRSANCTTMLHWAIQNRHLNIVERLVAKGADFNAKCGNLTPLQRALNNNVGNGALISLHLATNGANIKSLDQFKKERLLDLAVIHHSIQLVETLLKVGVNINKQNDPPLYLAVVHGHADMVEPLLEKGADINYSNRYDGTLMQIAERKRDTEIQNILARHLPGNNRPAM